jgi:hypothetical protein
MIKGTTLKGGANMKALNKIFIVQNDLVYPATVVNCSERGMYVKSEVSFPLNTMLNILIPVQNERLKRTVKVLSSIKGEKYYLLLQDAQI